MKALTFSFPGIIFCFAIYLNSTSCKDRNLEQLLHLYEEYIEYVEDVYDASESSFENEEDRNKSDYSGEHLNVTDSQDEYYNKGANSDEFKESDDVIENYVDELIHKFDIEGISTESAHYNKNVTDVNQWNNVEEPDNDSFEENTSIIVQNGLYHGDKDNFDDENIDYSVISDAKHHTDGKNEHKFDQVETTALPESGNDTNDDDRGYNDIYRYVEENQDLFSPSTDKSAEEKSIEELSAENHTEEGYVGHDYYNLNSDGNDLESSSVTYIHKNKSNSDFTSESNEYNSDEYSTENKVASQSFTDNYNESDTLTNSIFDFNVQTNDESSTYRINNHNQGNNFDYSVLDDKKYDSEPGESGLQDLIHSFLKYFEKNRSDWYKKWKFPL